MSKFAPHKIHKHPALRRFVLPVVKFFSPGNVSFRHHHTKQRYRLHFWRHKGYWYHGKRRESETMEFFQQALKPGDTAIEVGGHIGYISMWLAHLVGENGRLVVFEPGSNNLDYIRANVGEMANVDLIEKAVSNEDGVARFFEEELTGQNNSLVEDYDVFEQNRDAANSDQTYNVCEVETVRLDGFVAERGLKPSLFKIDVEGAELQVLEGARETLAANHPAVVIEVTNQRQDVCKFLTDLGYQLYDAYGRKVDPERRGFNVFALQPDKHADLIAHISKEAG
jgi:FkbM family methyltransferase